MGTIRRFDLSRIVSEYHTIDFFETGTFRGDGVAYALQSPFKKIISVEIIREIADDAKAKFSKNENVKIIEADSVTALENELTTLKGNCVFWLDAHFPGADAGLTAYDADNAEDVRLPLEKELETIKRLRPGFGDVFILDDLRIYEDGPFENGNVPPDALPKMNRSIEFAYRLFGKTHFIVRCYRDEGYILMFPRKIYRKRHFSFASLFTWRLSTDFYLVK